MQEHVSIYFENVPPAFKVWYESLAAIDGPGGGGGGGSTRNLPAWHLHTVIHLWPLRQPSMTLYERDHNNLKHDAR